MPNYLTPDVYVEEISTLPPSIAQVSTAIPVFFGHTGIAERNGGSLVNVPVRINTFLEFKTIFGGPDRVKFTIALDSAKAISTITPEAADKNHRLYYAMDHFFKNGGSTCYVVSTGTYDQAKSKDAFAAALDAIAKEDEPTLIVLSEATTLDSDDYYELCQQALQQCEKLGDRFCIIDVLAEDKTADTANVQRFRNSIGTNSLKYGAAYYPYLNTTLNYVFDEADVVVTGLPNETTPVNNTPAPQPASLVFTKDLVGVRVGFTGTAADAPAVEVLAGKGTSAPAITVANRKLTITNVGQNGKAGTAIAEAWSAVQEKGNFTLQLIGDGSQPVPATPETALTAPMPSTTPSPSQPAGKTLQTLQQSQTALYNTIKLELGKLRLTLPPSPAVAGVYASVDRERGVWKAPANVSLNAVIGTGSKISASDQENLNVDPNGGKSINAIRSFFGKGTMIWGARTLAGNDNEWRYIPVRRLFNMMEESAKKASYFAVFEPNNAVTWLKVKGMIESYLYGLWQQGALAGSTPKSAYYVNIGLGTTMTTQDILEGRMIIEIGIAAVRPAEFIILRFSHKLQEA